MNCFPSGFWFESLPFRSTPPNNHHPLVWLFPGLPIQNTNKKKTNNNHHHLLIPHPTKDPHDQPLSSYGVYLVCCLSGPSVRKELKRDFTNFFHSCKGKMKIQHDKIFFLAETEKLFYKDRSAIWHSSCVLEFPRKRWVGDWNLHLSYQAVGGITNILITQIRIISKVTCSLSMSSGRLTVPWPSWVVRTRLKIIN